MQSSDIMFKYNMISIWSKRRSIFIILISISLFLVPFFWLRSGELDIGGDSSRLYYYDPYGYLKNVVLYTISPEGKGLEFSFQNTLPFVVFLLFLKTILQSSSTLINIVNGTSLVIGFLSVYGIIKELLVNNIKERKNILSIELSSIFGGLLYLFLPLSFSGGWDRALSTHTQIFVNPLMVWFVIRFIHTSRLYFLLFALLVSFLFSHNFSFAAAPKFTAFFSTTMLYLAIYGIFLKKRKISLKILIVIFLLFVSLHAFHLIPQFSNTFEKSSLLYYKVFTSDAKNEAISTFLGALTYVTQFSHLIGLPSIYNFASEFMVGLLLLPLLIIIGSIKNAQIKQKEKELSLVFLFILLGLLITFFLVTANITDAGVSFYKLLFSIPGFTMFRSFEGQWLYAYVFFYVLACSFSLFFVIRRFGRLKQFLFFSVLTSVILINAIPFIRGDIIRSTLAGSKTIKSPIIMDPQYEKMIQHIRDIPYDSKFMQMPFVDGFYQVLTRENGGAYMGPSTLAYISGKKDFGTTTHFAPFTHALLQSAKEKDLKTFNNIMPLLNIGYLFYNSDPYMYDSFPTFPYQEVREYMPGDQKSYIEFIKKLPLSNTTNFGSRYHIYKVNNNLFLPHIYIAKTVMTINSGHNAYEKILKDFRANDELRNAFLYTESGLTRSSYKNIPQITFTKINPTKYIINVSNAKEPYLLVFSEAFNPDWELFYTNNKYKNIEIINRYFNNEIRETKHNNIFFDKETLQTLPMKSLADEKHFLVNGYANSWYIAPSDTKNSSYTLILEMTSQRLFYLGLFISALSFVSCLSITIMLLLMTNKKKL